MIRGRPVALLAAAALAAGALAYLVYFWWPSPLLDGSRIDAFAYGPYGGNIREFERHERADDGAFLDEVIGLVNEARLSGDPATPSEGDVLLVLFRDDGLQFHLTLTEAGGVGLSEGDGSYRGSLRSPELAGLLAGLRTSAPGGDG